MTTEILHPSWLNLDFFYTILRNNKHFRESTDSIHISSIHIEPATAAGDNYMSSIYRVFVEFCHNSDKNERHSLPLIVKLLLQGGPIEEIIEQYNAFPKEIIVYSELIPAFEAIWEKAGYPVQFGPRCLFTSENPNSVIVMDDLKANGYKMIPRQKGLTVDETKILIAKIAKFHAASVIHYDENGPYNNLFNEGIARMDVKEGMSQYYNTMYRGMMEMLENMDFAAPYVPKLKMWENKIFDTLYRLTQAESNSFNVMNHGDAWTNNLMFKQSDGVSEVLLVDFQLSSWTSPAYDILYIIFNACNIDSIINHFDDLVQFYHSELLNNFKKLNKPQRTPSFNEINSTIHRKGFIGAMMIVESVPIMKSDPDFKIQLELLVNENEKGIALKRKIFSAEHIQEIYKKLLPFLDERGFLDIPV